MHERTAIVTGGASGIGLAIAERLASDGAAVSVFDRDGAAAEAAAAKIVATGGSAVGFAVDVTERAQLDAAVVGTRERLGAPAILVNSAGLDGFDEFLSITPEKWARIIEVNLTGTFNCCQAVVPDMVAAGWGRIVNISSSSAQGGQPLMTHYVAAKAGVIGFTKGLLGKGVETNAALTPVRRVGRPEDIAAACAYLVSEEAGYVTGQVIGVNGGRNT
jgi:2-hydroxycyclohexanecarboxyl-CoA dehydrogenase